MESWSPDYEEGTVPILGALNIARHIRNYRNGWRFEPIGGFEPLLDTHSPRTLTLAPSADGPIGTLARIELNSRQGRSLDEGLTHSLNDPEAP